MERYNRAVNTDVTFDPNVKDGRHTNGLDVPKSNWANTLDDGPFEAHHITSGITFTFGGLRIDPHTSQVISDDQEPIPSLYTAE
jgi:tricarballylate dehydrogenase